jgi:hypothetical protein
MKEDEMTGHVAQMREMSIQPIAEPRLGPEENIKIDLKGMLWGSN